MSPRSLRIVPIELISVSPVSSVSGLFGLLIA
jgi:hypothetical protein